MSKVEYWKNPLGLNLTKGRFKNPAGDLLEELTETEMELLSGGGCPWWNVSCHMGNDGKICTYTYECVNNCRA